MQEWTLLLKIKIKKINFHIFFLLFIALKKCTNLPDRCHPLKISDKLIETDFWLLKFLISNGLYLLSKKIKKASQSQYYPAHSSGFTRLMRPIVLRLRCLFIWRPLFVRKKQNIQLLYPVAKFQGKEKIIWSQSKI